MLRQRLEVQYEKPQSQDVYRLRRQKVELLFGHIKHNLKANPFLLRGLQEAKAEVSLLASCFNICRMITLLGVPVLVKELNS